MTGLREAVATEGMATDAETGMREAVAREDKTTGAMLTERKTE